MANNNVYVIRIENGAVEAVSPLAYDTRKSEPKKTVGQQRADKIVKALVAYDKYAAPFVESVVQHQVGTINLRTGAEELQQRVEFGLGIAKQVGGLATSVLTGYAIGNLPGAIIGGLISGITTVINYANKADTLRMEQNLESISLRGMNVRAGGYAPSYGASRTARQ